MIDPAGGEAKRSLQVGGFEVRHFVQDLLGRESGSNRSSTSLTRMRMPRMQGRPPHCSGSTVILSAIMFTTR
jgi:hypothetical protein